MALGRARHGGLVRRLPNFAQHLDEVKRQRALSQDSDEGLELMPMLLLGPPRIGKTHFVRQLAQLVGTRAGSSKPSWAKTCWTNWPACPRATCADRS
jgi:hypothetical protein